MGCRVSYGVGGAYSSERGRNGNGICEVTSNAEVEVVIKDERGIFQMTLNFSLKEKVISLRRLRTEEKAR